MIIWIFCTWSCLLLFEWKKVWILKFISEEHSVPHNLLTYYFSITILTIYHKFIVAYYKTNILHFVEQKSGVALLCRSPGISQLAFLSWRLQAVSVFQPLVLPAPSRDGHLPSVSQPVAPEALFTLFHKPCRKCPLFTSSSYYCALPLPRFKTFVIPLGTSG